MTALWGVHCRSPRLLKQCWSLGLHAALTMLYVTATYGLYFDRATGHVLLHYVPGWGLFWKWASQLVLRLASLANLLMYHGYIPRSARLRVILVLAMLFTLFYWLIWLQVEGVRT